MNKSLKELTEHRDKCVFCQNYARESMRQWKENITRNCKFKVGGVWAPSYGFHFNFCLKVGISKAMQAMWSRQASLDQCRQNTQPQAPPAAPKPCKVAYDPAGQDCQSSTACSYFTIYLHPKGKICVLGCPSGQVRWGKRCQDKCPPGYDLALRVEHGRRFNYCIRRCEPGYVRLQVRKSPLTGQCVPQKRSSSQPLWKRGKGSVNPNSIQLVKEYGAPDANWYIDRLQFTSQSAKVRLQHYLGQKGPLNSDWEFHLTWKEPPAVLEAGETFKLFITAQAIPHKPGLIGGESPTFHVGGGISVIHGTRSDSCGMFAGMTGRGEKIYAPKPKICHFKVASVPLDEMWMSITLNKGTVVVWKYKKVKTGPGRVSWVRQGASRR